MSEARAHTCEERTPLGLTRFSAFRRNNILYIFCPASFAEIGYGGVSEPHGAVERGLGPGSLSGERRVSETQVLASFLPVFCRVDCQRVRRVSTCVRASRRGAPRATAEEAEGGSDGGRLQGVMATCANLPAQRPPSGLGASRGGLKAMREVIVRGGAVRSTVDGGARWGITGRTTRPQNHEELEESWLLPLWACGKKGPRNN